MAGHVPLRLGGFSAGQALISGKLLTSEPEAVLQSVNGRKKSDQWLDLSMFL